MTPHETDLEHRPAAGTHPITPQGTPAAAAGEQDRVEQNLTDAVATVAGEIGRTDTKASLLLAFSGAVIAGLLGAADQQLPLASRIAGGAAIAALAAAAVVLLLVVRPNLGGGDRASFPYWAQLAPHQIRVEMSDDRRPERIRVLSRIAVRKFRGLRRAVHLSLTAIAFLTIAALTALWKLL